MNFILSTQSEWLKTRRTASFWLSIVGAAFIPTVLFIVLMNDHDASKNLAKDPWNKFLSMGWQMLSAFLLPMYIILVSTLITQIEFKNNTWKQVYASPQSIANIFFSKFLTIHLMIVSSFLLFNVLMILSPMLANLFKPEYTFFDRRIDWKMLWLLNLKTYISILGISAIQYGLSLRFKNFIAPVGVGLVLVIGSIVAFNLHWDGIDKYPYAFALLSFDTLKKGGRPIIENHEWNSIGYFTVATLLGFLDVKMRKEKG